MDEYESLSHTKWTANTTCVHYKVSDEDAFWAYPTTPWGSVPQVGRAEGKPDRGGAFAAGSRAHVDLDPAEIRGVASDRLHQGLRARSTLHGCMATGNEISSAKASGLAGFSSPRSGAT